MRLCMSRKTVPRFCDDDMRQTKDLKRDRDALWRPSVRILGKLARAGQGMQPRFTPLDPDLIARRKVGRWSVQGPQAKFRLIFPEAEKPAAADGAEAATGEGGDLAAVGKSLTRPDRKEDEGGAARFAAIGAVAEADAKRLAFHPVGDRAAKAASGSDPHGARQASRLVGRPGGRRFAAINRSSSVADGPNFS